MTAWRHITCQKPPKGLNGSSELSGMHSLSSEDKKKVEEWLAGNLAPGGKKRSTAELEEMAKKDPKKMKKKELDEALKEAGVSVKSKKEKEEAMEEVVERASVRDSHTQSAC